MRVVSGAYSDVSPAFTLRGIRIVSPNTGSVWNAWTPQAISWQYAGIDLGARMSLSLSTDGGITFPYDITNNYPLSTTVFPWNNHPPYEPVTNAVIRMQVISSPRPEDTNVVAYSDVFTLRGIQVKAPQASNAWQLGTTNTIVFVAAAAGSSATISYSPDSGSSYEALPVVTSLPIVNGTNTYPWGIEMSRQPSVTARLRVAGTTYTGYSPIFVVGGVRVERPFQYDIWAVGETNEIRWISVGTQGTNLLELIYNGYPPYTITNNYEGTTLNWLVPSNAIPGGLDTITNVVLRVRDTGGYEARSQPFKMVSTPRVEIISPMAGDFWKVGQTKSVQWLKGGQMSADQFKIFYSQDNFATIRGEVLGVVSFNSSNNIFSIDWSVPDQLGATRFLVTNTVNSLVYDISGSFDVCGNFRVIYPNGVPPEPELYALNTASVSWGTRGSVPSVDLYYRYETNAWTKINTSPIANNGGGIVEQLTAASWLIPNLQSTAVRFRVQASNYTNFFDGVTPGPYDDSDNDFEIKYYTIYWDLYYVDSLSITSRLDRLSVADSSGWSQSSLSCLDGSGAPQLVMHKYPYGVYDTAWYREYFHDQVDFHWVCNTNQTRHIRMYKAEVEPEYHVLANFAYDISNRTFTIHSWLERNGVILSDPARNTISIYMADGAAIEALTTNRCDQNGVFWQRWSVGSTESRLGVEFTTTDIFFAKVDIEFSDVTYSAGLTFSLRLAAGEETVQAMQAIVSAATSNILAGVNAVGTNVSNIGSNLNAFRGETQASLSNLTSMGATTTNLLTGLSSDMQTMTNALLPGISLLTNQIATLLPTMTNLSSSITNLATDIISDLARILTRPTSLEFGSTNAFLYKTRPGYGAAVVNIRVRTEAGVDLTGANMTEIVSGIYQQDLVANWGTNSYIILCSDPQASDSMVVKVTGVGTLETVPAQIAALGTQLDQVQASVTNIAALVGGISLLEAQLTQIETVVSNVESQLGAFYLLTNQLTQVQEAVTGMASQIGSIAPLSNQMAQVQVAITNMTTQVGGLAGVGAQVTEIRTVVTNIDARVGAGTDLTGVMTSLGSIQTAVEGIQGVDLSQLDIAAQIDLSGITRIESQLGHITDTASMNTFLGRLESLSSQINSVGGAASDASKKAQTAKTQASSAASGVQSLKGEIAKGDLAGAINRLEEIKVSLSAAKQDMNVIPKLIRVAGLVDALNRMAGQIEELAESKGWDYLINLGEPAGEGGEEGGGVGGDAIGKLNSNIEEVRSSMLFMQKLMDEMRYEPVVQEELRAAP
jgi:hypothetical protein